MVIQEAGEMYLETIYILSKELPKVRAVDITKKMGFSKPTISIQMKKFRENGYVSVNEDGGIVLTKQGLEIAERIYERHVVISQILIKLGVDEPTAYQDACRIEHYISDTTFQCMKRHFKDKA